jgi:DNA helicase IV
VASADLTSEREYVATLYARLDELRDDAREQLEAVRRTNQGGTHQNRSERDAFARIYEDRVSQLTEIDERLAFGRLELEPVGDEPTLRYIGRIGLRDENLQPILLDWRVPQARAFYQATAATPLGARARRHITSKGREVVRVDDEIFDAAMLEGDTSALQGEAALLATLTAQRTGRMGDIVATIQAEQDRIIRSDLRGVLVVQGGPGTGKTAVALHRAAYLLYSYRDRLATSGVLIVGPSRSFLQYIEAVLPSLGETGVVLSSVGQLYPGLDTATEDAQDVSVLKGSVEMAALLARAVKSRQVVPREVQTLEVNGEYLAERVDSGLVEGGPRDVVRLAGLPGAVHGVLDELRLGDPQAAQRRAGHVQQGRYQRAQQAARRAAARPRQHDRRQRPGVVARRHPHRRRREGRA